MNKTILILIFILILKKFKSKQDTTEITNNLGNLQTENDISNIMVVTPTPYSCTYEGVNVYHKAGDSTFSIDSVFIIYEQK